MTLKQSKAISGYNQNKPTNTNNDNNKSNGLWIWLLFVVAFVFCLHSFFIGYLIQKGVNKNGRIQNTCDKPVTVNFSRTR